MNALPPCRWRERHEGDALVCHSVKFIAPPNSVTAGFCETCCYCDHAPGEIPSAPGSAGRRIAVATLYTPEMADLGRLSSGALRAYAARHGYEAVIATAPIDPARPPSWSKLLLIERHMARNPACEWLMWIDADAVVTNPARRVEDLIGGDIDFLVAEDLPPSPMNLGVFLIRNCPATLDLLRRAYAKAQYTHHPWWEQPAVVEALAEGGGAVRFRVVPRRLFNAFPGEHRAGDFVLHFAGSSPEAKLAGVRKAVLAARDDTPEGSFSFEPPAHPHSIDLAHTVFMSGCVLSKKPERVLELGIGPGHTSWALARALAYNGKGSLTCVDGWCDWGGREPDHVEALRRAGVEVIAQSEEEFVRSCPSERFDVLVSDADHGRSQEWLDDHLRLVKPGGFLFFHDTNNPLFPNLRAIVERVAHLPHYHFAENSRPDESCSRGLLFVMKQ
jgi:predicted O-methyltransferase YrrM